jgi:hypothetical protein
VSENLDGSRPLRAAVDLDSELPAISMCHCAGSAAAMLRRNSALARLAKWR